jgi:hypothetical protein
MTNLSDKYKDSLPFDSSNITTIVSNYTASDNETVFVNSASSALTVTLPASPTQGSKIKVLDIATNSQNNNISVLGNGNNIGGASAYIINTPDSSVEVMYINAIKGWNILNQYVSLAKPGIPTGVSATDIGTGRAYNNGAATVSFTPPTSGGAIDLYTVTSTPGNYTATGVSSPILVEGLQSGVSYTFTVSASNLSGTTVSNSSSIITTTTVPQAPLMGTATDVGTGRAYNNGAATITFTNQGTGGTSITSYNVISNVGEYTASGSSSPITQTGLQSGSSYTFTITATNANGTSISSSSSNSITATTVPQAPTLSSTSYGFESANITFSANATGGSSITGYTATSNPGSVTGSGSSSPLKVNGLTAGTSYTFTVVANNVNGSSISSSTSSSVIPFTASGGSITTSEGYRIHTFTGSSALTLSGNSTTVDYLVVAGGGGGARGYGGGGGAGGYREGSISISPSSQTVTVGNGGGGGVGNNSWRPGNVGGNSTFSSITSSGGGGGRTNDAYAGNGGSGGGAWGETSSPGNGTAGQGNNGGVGTNTGNYRGGGGGGAGAAGGSGNSGGIGGIGIQSSITGTTTYYAGGGGGGGPSTVYGGTNAGGLGGGGRGGNGSGQLPGSANTGGGGGAAGGVGSGADGGGDGQSGGSGIVIVRYLI